MVKVICSDVLVEVVGSSLTWSWDCLGLFVVVVPVVYNDWQQVFRSAIFCDYPALRCFVAGGGAAAGQRPTKFVSGLVSSSTLECHPSIAVTPSSLQQRWKVVSLWSGVLSLILVVLRCEWLGPVVLLLVVWFLKTRHISS